MKKKLSRIMFELTSHCNLRCKYCYNIWKASDKEFVHFNSYKKAKKVLKQLFKLADVEHITFTGGEPTLAERFKEILLVCRMREISINLITNGNSATKDDYADYKELGVKVFQLPFHSHIASEHDSMSGVVGSFEKVCTSIEQLRSLNAYIVAVLILTNYNAHSIEETLVELKRRGIRRIMLNRFNIGGEGIEFSKDLLLSHEDLNIAYATANNMAKKLNLTISSNVCSPRCILDPSKYRNITFAFCSPSVENKPLTLDLEGNLRICNHSPVNMGNIFKETFSQIFNSAYVRSWKELVPEYCKDCKDYSRCFAGCRAASEQLGFGLATVDPYLLFRKAGK